MTISTLIFGPTGNVASAAARYTHSRGVHVYLAMRNTSKSIPNLSSAAETAGNYTRIQADLLDPDSIVAAVRRSNAHSAFLYLLYGHVSQMKTSIETLKAVGVQHIVFLSSFTIDRPVREVPQEAYITWAHAQVEGYLEDVYGEGNFTAVRGGSFATNLFRQKAAILQGKPVLEVRPQMMVDWVVPEDIGNVVGSVLALQDTKLPRSIDVLGPELTSFEDAYGMLAWALGREIQVVDQEPENAIRDMMDHLGFSEQIARYLIQLRLDKAKKGEKGILNYHGLRYEEATKSVKKYTGCESTTLAQWIDENKNSFV